MLFALRRETTQLLTLVQTVQLYPVKLCKHLPVLKRKKKSQLKVRFLACSGDLSFVTQSSAANSRVARSIETLSKLQ